nr:MAG TPA: structural protein [Caudoviricetes sp.]
MILPPLQVIKPFDPSGSSEDNLIQHEVHDLPPFNKRIIAPRFGAFYRDSLIVQHGQKVLELDKDYEIAAPYQDATVEVGQPVNVLICFTNENIIGNIEISYQCVGGHLTGTFQTIEEYINALLVDARKVKWDDILAKPDMFVPMDHFHDIRDVYGLNAVVPILEEMRLALLQVRSKSLRKIYDRLLQYRKEFREEIVKFNNLLLTNGVNANTINDQLNTVLTKLNLVTDSVADTKNKLIAKINSDVGTLSARDAELARAINTAEERILQVNQQVVELSNRKVVIPISSEPGNLISNLNEKLFVRIDGAIRVHTPNVVGEISFDGADTFSTRQKLVALDLKATSDMRLKESVKPIEDPLYKVSKLNGYTFKYKDTEGFTGGLSAQEVRAVLPELVSEDSDQHLNLSYNGVVGLLVESVKALAKENEELRARLDRIDRMEGMD